MTDIANKALLPDGLHDLLPPEAEHEADVVGRLMARFSSHGYQRVKAPLMEFENSLLAGPGEALAPSMFRLMDPVSRRMLGVRADITPQIARIASTRLRRAQRPLRLSYAGQVLRTQGSQLRPERQVGQAGVELIGAPVLNAEVEVATLAAETLRELGVQGLSVDFCLPRLVGELCRAYGFDAETTGEVRSALDGKDAAKVAAVPGPEGKVLAGLLAAAGPAARALQALAALDLPPAGAALREELDRLVSLVRAAEPELAVTIDPGEFRGFDYQMGICFTLFAKGVRGELGRGGRYVLDGGEPAVGFTIYLESLLRALPDPSPEPLVYLPFGAAPAKGAKLRAEGWRTVRGLSAQEHPETEARRLGCSHVLAAGRVKKLA